MIARYNRLSFLWGIPGILLQFVGNFIRVSASSWPNIGPKSGIGILITLIGTVLLLIGLAYYAKAKGRNPAW